MAGPTLNTLATFNGANGSKPHGELIADASGNLYGTTRNGGAGGDGTVFEITSGTNTITTLATFSGDNGSEPHGGLLADASGNLYGTTLLGGSNNQGTVFKISAGTNTLSTLASFNSATGGSFSDCTLIADTSGNLYGTTENGGTSNYGTVFKIAAGTNTLTTLASFNITNGANPLGPLFMDTAGNLYGTTAGGGSSNMGTVFKVAAGTNAVTTVVSFNGANGSTPCAGLIADGLGNLYGTSSDGGPDYDGIVFKIATKTNTLSTVAAFNSANGYQPECGLIADAAGNLYGTTQGGGSGDAGVVFKVAAGTGAISTLATFNRTDGATPYAGLIVDASGNLYGTTFAGGSSGNGTVFEVTGTGFVVPEPSSLVLAALSSGLLLRRRGSKARTR